MTTTDERRAVDPAADMSGADEYRERGTFRVIVQDDHYCVPRFCPHRGGRLGVVNGKRRTITCPLHHSTFSLETGAQITGPACGPLAIEKIEKIETIEERGEPCS
jgi:nitrite reductase/ring-hydroxylating ferredoxin subunit